MKTSLNSVAGQPVVFACGARMKNRFMLAPMTNCQSHSDGRLSDEEFHWLTMRAEGNFGLTMTCASHVQENGQGFPGQLGIYSDDLLVGHRRLAKAIQAHGSLAVIQLHHAGMRSPADLIGGVPVSPSAQKESGARALSTAEVQQLRDDFIRAAKRSKQAGYDGVEIHGAHGYILCQFLSPQHNRRKDEYGGSLQNRARIFYEITDGVRRECGSEFLIGVRLSPERFGMDVASCKRVARGLINAGKIDFLDWSLWDYSKYPEDEGLRYQTLLEHVMDLDRKSVLITAAGKISTAKDVEAVLRGGVDFVTIGRAAILHHDFPDRVLEDADFEPIGLPVSVPYLKNQGLSEAFVQYMSRWKGFVANGMQ